MNTLNNTVLSDRRGVPKNGECPVEIIEEDFAQSSENDETDYDDEDDGFDEWTDPSDRGLHPNRQLGGGDNKTGNRQNSQLQQTKFQNTQKVN